MQRAQAAAPPCPACPACPVQALGLRALWRVHSPSDRHEPLELLTNDLPQVGPRRAYTFAVPIQLNRQTRQFPCRKRPTHHPTLLCPCSLQHDNGMRRAWSRTRLAALPDGAHRHSTTAAQAAPLRRAGPAGLPKDPSLSTLLLGEVAEVC